MCPASRCLKAESVAELLTACATRASNSVPAAGQLANPLAASLAVAKGQPLECQQHLAPLLHERTHLYALETFSNDNKRKLSIVSAGNSGIFKAIVEVVARMGARQ
jgi:hypothetical protein